VSGPLIFLAMLAAATVVMLWVRSRDARRTRSAHLEFAEIELRADRDMIERDLIRRGVTTRATAWCRWCGALHAPEDYPPLGCPRLEARARPVPPELWAKLAPYPSKEIL
jgi:hypothetical protein